MKWRTKETPQTNQSNESTADTPEGKSYAEFAVNMAKRRDAGSTYMKMDFGIGKSKSESSSAARRGSWKN